MVENDWVIVKVTENHIVLMNSDGSFKNVKRSRDQFPLIGERFNLKEPYSSYLPWTKIVTLVACLFIFSFFAWYSLSVSDPQVAYIVALDINPSIEVSTDKDLNVVELMALNEAGQKIISNVSYKGKNFSRTINKIIEQCIQYGYFNHNEQGLITISVIPSLEKNESRESDIKKSINDSLKNNRVMADVNMTTADNATLEKAHRAGLSVNKYKLYKVITDTGIPLSIEEAKNKTVKNMMEMIPGGPGMSNKSVEPSRQQPITPGIPPAVTNKIKDLEANPATPINQNIPDITVPSNNDEKNSINDTDNEDDVNSSGRGPNIESVFVAR
ncbi:MAG: hypothetical protein CVU89_09565 [Firmicutes bacterium HGW-Firmicutes-14]|jgi:hypothetical protein|nr:MAG: hypothetical protein CVU89_09565 [Firmicutes bacterium HGW-Firmicutes-14]